MGNAGCIVSPHVRKRFVERFSHELGSHVERDVTALIYSEVMQALEAGRMAKTRPSWCALASRQHAGEGARYVWNEHRSRAYVVGKMRDSVRAMHNSTEVFTSTWVVRTVLPANDNEVISDDMRHVHRWRQEESKRLKHKRGKGKAR